LSAQAACRDALVERFSNRDSLIEWFSIRDSLIEMARASITGRISDTVEISHRVVLYYTLSNTGREALYDRGWSLIGDALIERFSEGDCLIEIARTSITGRISDKDEGLW